MNLSLGWRKREESENIPGHKQFNRKKTSLSAILNYTSNTPMMIMIYNEDFDVYWNVLPILLSLSFLLFYILIMLLIWCNYSFIHSFIHLLICYDATCMLLYREDPFLVRVFLLYNHIILSVSKESCSLRQSQLLSNIYGDAGQRGVLCWKHSLFVS